MDARGHVSACFSPEAKLGPEGSDKRVRAAAVHENMARHTRSAGSDRRQRRKTHAWRDTRGRKGAPATGAGQVGAVQRAKASGPRCRSLFAEKPPK